MAAGDGLALVSGDQHLYCASLDSLDINSKLGDPQTSTRQALNCQAEISSS